MFNKAVAVCMGVIGSTLATVSSISLFSEWPYLKYLEIYFYDKDSQEEKVRLWIEDIGNLSKAQYFKKNSVVQTSTNSTNGTWEYLYSSESDTTDYGRLAILAKQFIETQHYLNIARAVHTVKNWKETSEIKDVTIKCSGCCKKSGETCTCKSCLCCFSNDTQCCKSGQTDCKIANLKKQQNQFAYYLSNLHSPFNNAYLSPVQAHIKLLDASFASDLKVAQPTGSSSSSSTSSKNMVGTLVYGFVDYYYKEVNMSNQEEFTKSVKNDLEVVDNKKYFYSIPQQFNFKLDNSVDSNKPKLISEIYEEFVKNPSEKVTGLVSKINDDEVKCCCCDDEANTLECLVKRNFILSESSLETIQTKVKTDTNCCSKS